MTPVCFNLVLKARPLLPRALRLCSAEQWATWYRESWEAMARVYNTSESATKRREVFDLLCDYATSYEADGVVYDRDRFGRYDGDEPDAIAVTVTD